MYVYGLLHRSGFVRGGFKLSIHEHIIFPADAKTLGHASRKFNRFNGWHFLLCSSEKLDSRSVMKLGLFRKECNFMVAAV